MTRVVVVNAVLIDFNTQKIENTNQYEFYHPACWDRVVKALVKSPVGTSYGVATLETDDQEILSHECGKCENPLMGDAPDYGKYRYRRG